MTGLTLRELCAALVDELAIYAPSPPPDRLLYLIEIADDYAPDADSERSREDDEEGGDDEDGGDYEPSLGWTIGNTFSPSQHGGQLDLEDEHDGCEPCEDRESCDDSEPSLGWTATGVMGGVSDFEQDDAHFSITNH
jgi:hypothetical protein